MVGTKIRDEDRKNIHSKYICTYCDDLLVNPIQTSCEHSFCQSCIEILLGRPNPKCTEDEEHLNRNNIFPNDDIKQELNCIVLHCPNEKCKWLGPYQELKGHIGSTCEYAPVVCAYCKDRIRRKDIEDHLNKFCRKIHVRIFRLIYEKFNLNYRSGNVIGRLKMKWDNNKKSTVIYLVCF
ncbi:TNF receptor-associated factor 3-like isoform X1 [Xenia sp. Carnegie-2017]|uniref:TNF receptor-associated factor 3-like isoform X1 n=1 Tax=Xenia sp. Carnegie-2017 TaxID=2897299 RepID=UPI001F043112|nr:TNF receptor-associated factor 3-like isoform X1 [Xenia sp. Carnegie-2017]XP_046855660.1 TNF receptor-associated factor 3-like isoform X1 [Xenia sp. Carnegie-2017]